MDKLASKEFVIGMTYSHCCGVKEVHNIYGYRDPKECMLAILRPYMFSDSTELQQLAAKIYPRYFASVIWGQTELRQSSHILWMGLENYKKVFGNGFTGCVAMHSMLKDLVSEQKLGDVWESQPGINGNTDNPVILYVWTPNWDNVRLWWDANFQNKTLMERRIEKIKAAFGGRFREYSSPAALADPELLAQAKEAGLVYE